MRHPATLLLFLIAFMLISCSNRQVKIKHINFLTEVWGDTTNGKNWRNRDDYFIIYNSWSSNGLQEQIDQTIKPYVDSFSSKFSNYTITLYKESKYADTTYIKSFPERLYYKALLDDKPYMTLQWYSGHLINTGK